MGTNYYLTSKVCPCCKRAKPPMHLGKSSAGWQFLFSGYRPEYEGDLNIQTKQAWVDYINSSEDHIIQNEYGDPISLEALLELVENKRDGRSSVDDRYNLVSQDGYIFCYTEFS